MDNLVRSTEKSMSSTLHMSQQEYSYLNRLKRVCKRMNVETPFLLVINHNTPWGNVISYFFRSKVKDANSMDASEKLWDQFLFWDDKMRNKRIKFIPCLKAGPLILRKAIRNKPLLMGQKFPVTYYGSQEENYMEISVDVTTGSRMTHKITTAVASKGKSLILDVGWVIQGEEGELPERILGAYRYHHVDPKRMSDKEWTREMRNCSIDP